MEQLLLTVLLGPLSGKESRYDIGPRRGGYDKSHTALTMPMRDIITSIHTSLAKATHMATLHFR